MRSEKRNNLEGREVASVGEAREDARDAVLGLRNQALDGSDGLVGAASQELELRCTL